MMARARVLPDANELAAAAERAGADDGRIDAELALAADEDEEDDLSAAACTVEDDDDDDDDDSKDDDDKDDDDADDSLTALRARLMRSRRA